MSFSRNLLSLGMKRSLVKGIGQISYYNYPKPNTNWRLPISSAYVNGSANSTLAGTSSGKNFGVVTVPLSSTDYPLAWVFSTPVAAPGGLLYFYFSGGAPTFVFEYSNDTTNGTDGTWNAISYTILGPNGAASANKGDAVQIPTGAIGVRMKVTTNATASPIGTGVFQLNTDRSKNDLVAIVGMSITASSYNPTSVATTMRTIDANRDTISINLGVASAKMNTLPISMKVGQIDYLAASNLPFGWILFEPGPNDNGNSAASIQSDMQVCLNAMSGHESLGTQIYISGVSFNVNRSNKGFSDINNTGYGYESDMYYPAKKALHPKGAVQQDIDAPLIDMGTSLGLAYPALLNADGLHPNYLSGTRNYTRGLIAVARLQSGVQSPKNVLMETIEDAYAQGSGVPQYFKNRLTAFYNKLPVTTEPIPLSNRAALYSKLSSLSTSYIENAGGVPITPNRIACWDFDDFSTITNQRTISCTTVSGQSDITCANAGDLVVGAAVSGAGIPASSFITSIDVPNRKCSIAPNTASASATVNLVFQGCGDFVASVVDKVNGYVLSQSDETRMPYQAPAIMAGRGGISTQQTAPSFGVLSCSTSAMTTAFDAAGQDFTFAYTFKHRPDSGFAPTWCFGNGQIMPGLQNPSPDQLSNRTFGGLTESAGRYAAEVPHSLIITKTGTALRIIRNGVLTASGTYSKPATTSPIFVFGGRDPVASQQTCIGEFGLFYCAASGISGSSETDLINWLLKKTGRT